MSADFSSGLEWMNLLLNALLLRMNVSNSPFLAVTFYFLQNKVPISLSADLTTPIKSASKVTDPEANFE